jgi:predicted transcriptional regulator
MSDRLTFTLHELLAELDAFADGALRSGYGVTFNQFQFLALLYDAEPADMTTLARYLGVTKAAVSKRVPGLVEDGWITAQSPTGSSCRAPPTATVRRAACGTSSSPAARHAS